MKENKFDKFYTKEQVSRECLKYITDNIDCSEFKIVIEPSAGAGSFSNLFSEFFPDADVYAYDIEPQKNTILQQDFLELNTVDFKESSCLVVGNPPFGRQSSLAIKFIKKVCEFSSGFCFILPLSFRKDSMKASIDARFHLIFEKQLEKNSFIVLDKEHDVPCVFQIWIKKKKRRIQKKKYVPRYFDYVKKDNCPDFAFRRVGGNAGSATQSQLKSCSIQSHYFIKMTNEENRYKTENVVEKCNNFDWLKYSDNTSGPRSLSKQEISYHLDCFIGKSPRIKI